MIARPGYPIKVIKSVAQLVIQSNHSRKGDKVESAMMRSIFHFLSQSKNQTSPTRANVSGDVGRMPERMPR